MDLAKLVTTEAPYQWDEGSLWPPKPNDSRRRNPAHVVAYDYGIKRNILRRLADTGCRMTVVPATTPASDVLSLHPDGVFLSNGPGDPEPCRYAIEAIGTLVDAGLPTFGICLGHQLMALAGGARTVKMKFGHHGANHPVLDLDSGARHDYQPESRFRRVGGQPSGALQSHASVALRPFASGYRAG